MTISKHQLLSFLLSITMLMAALALLWLGYWLPGLMPEKIEIREIAVTLPPPPPPPPVVQQAVVETPMNLQVQGGGATLQMIEVEPNIEVIQPDIPIINTENTQWQPLEVDWNAFDLAQLDDLPTLLTELRVAFPQALKRRGIDTVLVRLDVMIDEQGRVTLIEIIQNPHPELQEQIERLVRNSRFTPPKRNSKTVRARFIWPVEIKS